MSKFQRHSWCCCKSKSNYNRQHGFKMYLGINCEVLIYNEKEYGLVFSDNPLNDFVELPEKYQSMWYSNLICGVITGALETVLFDYY